MLPFKGVGTAIDTVVAITVEAVGAEATGDRIVEDTGKDDDTEAAAVAVGDITDIKEATETAGAATEGSKAARQDYRVREEQCTK